MTPQNDAHGGILTLAPQKKRLSQLLHRSQNRSRKMVPRRAA